jgi:outer membrane protein TolC
MKKCLTALTCFAIMEALGIPGLPIRAEAPPRPATALDRIVSEALKNNPGLAAQRKKILAAEERPSQASALPDPTADLQFMMLPVNGGLTAGNALTKGVSIGVTQRLPYPGKLKLLKAKAERRIDVAKEHLKVMESNLRREVISASYRYVLYKGLLQINRNVRDALQAASTGAAGVYGAGNGSQTDVLLAQAALTKARADGKTLERQLEVARARLEDLLGGPVNPSLTGQLAIPRPGALPDLDELMRGLRDEAPTVLEARAEIAVRQEQVELAKKDFKPDFLVGGRYRHKDMTMGGHDYLTAMVGITLPFFHKKSRYQPALREATYMRESAKEQASDVLNQARYMVIDAYQAAVQDHDVYGLYETGLLVQSKKAYESALSSYTVGEVDFTTMLKALTNYYDYQSQALMFKADYQVSLARIDAVLGPAAGTTKESAK